MVVSSSFYFFKPSHHYNKQYFTLGVTFSPGFPAMVVTILLRARGFVLLANISFRSFDFFNVAFVNVLFPQKKFFVKKKVPNAKKCENQVLRRGAKI